MGKPTIVCLCGSTRFGDAFERANIVETCDGKIGLSVCSTRPDAELFGHLTEIEQNTIRIKLAELHRRKIDLADEILVLNVRGYIGDSTRGEIAYALAHGKSIRWLEPAAAEPIPPAD